MNDRYLPPPTPQDLISEMKKSYQAFLADCQKLTQEQALMPDVCGEWSAKEVVDHLTGWQIESLAILDQLLESESGDFDLDIDGFNRTSVKERKDLSWEGSLAAFELSFDDFNEGLAGIAEAQYGAKKGLRSWVKAMIYEYKFHLDHIRQAQQS